MTKPKSKKKKKFSILRVIIALIITITIIFVLIKLDYKLDNLTHYRDVGPVLSPDGKFIVYIRLHQNIKKYNDIEIRKIDVDGKNDTMLFTPPLGFNIFGVRRLYITGDNKYINLRLNRKLDGSIEDHLFKIPVSPGEETKTWQLHKNFPYDAFLAYKDNKVALRRMKETGKMSPSILYLYSFEDKKQLETYPFPQKGVACVFADFYGNSPRLYGVVHKLDPDDPEKDDSKLRLFESNLSIPFDFSMNGIRYLGKRNEFIGFSLEDNKEINIYNREKNEWTKIPNPAEKDGMSGFFVSKDENEIIVYSPKKFFIYSLDNKETTILPIPEGFITGGDTSVDGETLIYSDGNTINSIKRNGTENKQITRLSPKSDLLQHKIVEQYLKYRNRLFFKAYYEQEKHNQNPSHSHEHD